MLLIHLETKPGKSQLLDDRITLDKDEKLLLLDNLPF